MIDEEAEKKRAIADGIEKFATGIAILKDGKVLVVRRVKDDYLGGMYELPGGSVDVGEGIVQGAIRELAEETGLKATNFSNVFEGFDYTTPKPTSVRQFNFVTDYPGGEVKLDPSEHDDYKWIGRSEIDELNTTKKMAEILRAVPGLSE